jgi:hypothetical protein
MTSPFQGTIKMETIKDEDGNDKVVWDYSAPIVGPYNYPIQSNGRLSVDPMTGNVGVGKSEEYKLVASNSTEWARVDKDNNLVHLDMDLCAKGPANAYTALAVGIWNAAIEAAAKQVDHILSVTHATQGDVIRELKK